jgi:hypothetical protein
VPGGESIVTIENPYLAPSYLATPEGRRFAEFTKGLHSCQVSFSDDSEEIETDNVAKILDDFTPLHESNSIGSRVISSDRYIGHYVAHKPVLDLDMDVLVLPSSTPGHHHLYIDRAMPWNEYSLLLNVLAHVGILQDGYVRASHHRSESFLRTPWTRKA